MRRKKEPKVIPLPPGFAEKYRRFKEHRDTIAAAGILCICPDCLPREWMDNEGEIHPKPREEWSPSWIPTRRDK